jgi:hypothetical protein
VFFELLIVEISEIQHELKIHIQQTGDILRALNVAAHPVEGIGNAGKHHHVVPSGRDGFLLKKVTHGLK